MSIYVNFEQRPQNGPGDNEKNGEETKTSEFVGVFQPDSLLGSLLKNWHYLDINQSNANEA